MASAAAAAITVPAVMRIVPRAIRVVAVDGHQLVQEGLAAMINREEGMTVVATASSGAEALEDVRRYRPDVVTLDVLLPDMPGEDLARQILAEFPLTRIVAITSAQGHMHARRALDTGVHAYLSKAAPVYELVQAIRKVRAGVRVTPGSVAFTVASRLLHPGQAGRLCRSDRIAHRSIEACPFDNAKRSRLCQSGSLGSNRITRFQIV